MAGQAGVGLTKVLTGVHNTGIDGRPNFDEGVDTENPFPATADMCVFHRTITTADIPNDGNLLTDIVVRGNGTQTDTEGTMALPVDAFITVSGNVLYRP